MLFKKPENAGEAELERLFGEAAKRGAVLCLLHFDAHGPDKDSVTSSMVEFVGRLTKEQGVLYCRGEIDETIERDGFFSTCSEVKILADTFNSLMVLCLKYGPIAAEIIKPSEILLDKEAAQGLLVDGALSSQQYVHYILQKMAGPEDMKRLEEKRIRRAELGQKLLDKAKKG